MIINFFSFMGHTVRRITIRLVELLAGCFRIEFVLLGNSSRIGHFVMEPECYLRVNQIEGRFIHPCFLVETGRIANSYLLRLWSRCYSFVQIPSWLFVRLCEYVARNPESRFRYVYGSLDRYAKAWSRVWDQPLLSIPAEDRRRGETLLRQLGIPEGAWFVCLHVREAGFLPRLSYHSYRDCDIDTYSTAVDLIVSQGGYVVRMGDPSMKRIKSLPGVIDYAHSDLRSAFLDIFLCEHCRFFLGTSSGLVAVPAFFNRPMAEVNVVPFQYSMPDSLFIPKLIYSITESRLLTFEEVVRRGIHQYDFAELYTRNGCSVVDNEPEDILRLTEEMMAVVAGKATYNPDDLFLRQVFARLLQPLGLSKKRPAFVGRDFMRKHKAVFIPVKGETGEPRQGV